LGKNENIRKETKMTTEERLEKLERELAAAKRRNHWLLTIMALIIGGLTLVWTLTKTTSAAYAQEAEAVQKIIRASEFVLVDENGKIRAALSVSKDGAGLTLWDENGKFRASLSANKDGTMLGLRDENGKLRASLSAVKDGPGLDLFDENGKPRAGLAVLKDGSLLHLKDENGKTIWRAP
jgi:hypothetical protein